MMLRNKHNKTGTPPFRLAPFMLTALGDMPVACPVSAYFQKFSIYLKTFGEPCHIIFKI
jgi:hypothetical protein